MAVLFSFLLTCDDIFSFLLSSFVVIPHTVYWFGFSSVRYIAQHSFPSFFFAFSILTVSSRSLARYFRPLSLFCHGPFPSSITYFLRNLEYEFWCPWLYCPQRFSITIVTWLVIGYYLIIKPLWKRNHLHIQFGFLFIWTTLVIKWLFEIDSESSGREKVGHIETTLNPCKVASVHIFARRACKTLKGMQDFKSASV